MATWKRKPQEQEGTYFFSGKFVATKTVTEELSEIEILTIYQEIQKLVKEKNGLDYLQVFEKNGQRLFFIDQLNKEMIASGEFAPEHHYCTLLFDYEY